MYLILGKYYTYLPIIDFSRYLINLIIKQYKIGMSK